MVDRVIMDPTRVSVSAPGHDVKTAAIGNMIFDSRGHEYGGVFMTGTLSMLNQYQVTLPFGRTLPRVPYFWVMGRKWDGTWSQMGTRVESNNGSPYSQGITAFAGTSSMVVVNDSAQEIDLVRYVIFNIGAS